MPNADDQVVDGFSEVSHKIDELGKKADRLEARANKIEQAMALIRSGKTALANKVLLMHLINDVLAAWDDTKLRHYSPELEEALEAMRTFVGKENCDK
jgi:hypothetical protein